MSGVLKIHSNASEGGLFGHSWIEFCPIDGQPVTYGTWGNHPNNGANGLRENLELNRHGECCRVAFISTAQEASFFAVIAAYRAAGATAWSLGTPCSAFASEAWEAATGEQLEHRNALLSTPARLARSIAEANLDLGKMQDTHHDVPPALKGLKPKSD